MVGLKGNEQGGFRYILWPDGGDLHRNFSGLGNSEENFLIVFVGRKFADGISDGDFDRRVWVSGPQSNVRALGCSDNRGFDDGFASYFHGLDDFYQRPSESGQREQR